MPLKYKVVSDFSEAQIEADVAHYFGMISGRESISYRLFDTDEQLTGADKVFTNGIAYYMQFKKPLGLFPISKAAIPATKSPVPLQEIRLYRHKFKLDAQPYSICFKLRKKAKKALDFQHNILRKYENPDVSRAFYVCPTVLDHDTYQELLEMATDRFPLYYRDLHYRFGPKLPSQLASVPFLRAHASIVPHAKVNSSNHYYSFSRYATDIAFHSPEIVEKEPQRLSDRLATDFRRALSDIESIPSIRSLARSINETTVVRIPSSSLDDNPLTWLSEHGRLLRKTYGIRQVLALFGNG